MKFVHVVSISSGKDSQATGELALERVGKENVIMVFCDTGNEDEAVEAHLQYLEEIWGVPIVRLKANFDERLKAKRIFIANDRRVRKKRFRSVDKHTGEITFKVKSVRWTNKAKRRALVVLHPTGNPFHNIVQWAKTGHGGSQYDMLLSDTSQSAGCSSSYGLCDRGGS